MPKLILNNWSKGLWTAGPAAKAPANTLTRCSNMQYMDEGALQTRAGSALLYAVANTVDGLQLINTHFSKDNTGEIYDGAVDTGISQANRRLVATAMPVLGVSNDVAFFPRAMKKWHNSTASDWGIRQKPAAATTAVSSTTANLIGDYGYRIAFYNSNEKTLSSISDESTVVTAANQSIFVTLPTTCTDPQANYVRIWRSTGASSGASWYYLTDVALGISQYQDTTADTGLGDLLDYTIIYPYSGTIGGRYKNYMALAGVSGYERYIYYSNASYPEYFKDTQLELIADAGDTIEAIVEMGDYAVIIGQRSIYSAQIQGGIVYTAKVIAGRGTINGRTVAMGGAGIYFVSDDGIYVLSGFTPVKISLPVDAFFRGEDRGGLSTLADTTMCGATFVGGRYFFTYYGADSTWHTIVWNEAQQRFRHNTGWLWATEPLTGHLPVVGLSSCVAGVQNGLTDDAGTAYTSVAGFNLTALSTALCDIRWWRASVQSAGTVTVSFYDSGTLKYSLDLTAPSYATAYVKHGTPSGTYFMEPEVVLSSASPFTLHAFEVDVNFVRKYEADYTRSLPTSTGTEGAAAATGGGG